MRQILLKNILHIDYFQFETWITVISFNQNIYIVIYKDNYKQFYKCYIYIYLYKYPEKMIHDYEIKNYQEK